MQRISCFRLKAKVDGEKKIAGPTANAMHHK